MRSETKDVLVGLMIDPSPDLLVGILGILKSDSGFVPLDPKLPLERASFIISDCGIEVLVTQDKYLPRALRMSESGELKHIICLDGSETKVIHTKSAGRRQTNPVESGNGTKEKDTAKTRTHRDLKNTAYVIYTSGTTGAPKGVPISHENLSPMLLWSRDYFGLGDHTRAIQTLPYFFDFGIFEILTTILFGGTLYIAGNGSFDYPHYARLITELGINTIHSTPSLFREIISGGENLKSLKILHLGGETLTEEVLTEIRKVVDDECVIYNGYGPTEATINASIFRIDQRVRAGARIRPQEITSISIGRASANNCLYILDKNDQPLPIGVPGQLHISGVGLSRGYLKRPDLTAEKFIPNPFKEFGERLYRTGDLARYLPDGEIEFLGRLDSQVKVRGFRIELGEIESALNACPEVREAVVVAHEHAGGDKRLVAYLVARNQSPQTGYLRCYLKQRLPEYMVPSAFVVLEELPLTPNGKVDRLALPAPSLHQPGLEMPSVAPRTPMEEVIAGICAEVLGVEQVGIHDDFFDLGSHSLLITRIIVRLREALHVELPLLDVFQSPTVAGLSEAIERIRDDYSLQLPELRPAPRDGHLPLSFAQERVWFLDQLAQGNASYYIPRGMRIKGRLNFGAVAEAFSELVRRHEILRTSFPAIEGRPFQVIHSPYSVTIPVIDLQSLPNEERETELRRLILEAGRRPFDLAQIPLLRLLLIQLGEEECVLVLTEHHLIHDGWTQGVLLHEFLTLYVAITTGNHSPLPDLSIQYADFAYWQRQWLQGETLEAQLAYWKKQLAGAPALLELPADRPRPPVQSYRGAEQRLEISAELAESLRSLSRREGVTLFMTMLAAFKAMLSRYTGKTDICVGSGIANRRCVEIEGLLGMIINTVALRTNLSGDPIFRQLLGRVRETCLGAYAHQDLPFEKLVEELQPERSLSYSPFFQTFFAFLDTPMHEIELPGLSMELVNAHNRTAKFDLNIVCVLHAEQRIGVTSKPGSSEITMLVEYNTDIFNDDTIARMLEHFQNLLEGIVAHPEARISELPLLTEAERRQLLVEWNNPQLEQKKNAAIHELFELQVEQQPEAVAVLYGGDRVSYRELNRRSNQLAHHLRSLGVGPEVRVGLLLERSVEMIVSILGVLKAGGAYVPLEVAAPPERLNFMLEDAACAVLLSDQARAAQLSPSAPTTVIALDADWQEIASHRDENPGVQVKPQQSAYVIYTSGSTGKPKGVVVTHDNVVRLLTATEELFSFGPHDVWTMFHSYAFDFSVWEIWGALIYGGRLVVVPHWVSRAPDAFYELLLREHVTVLNQTPSAFRQLMHAQEQAIPTEKPTVQPVQRMSLDDLALRVIIFGGEALNVGSLRPWFDKHLDTKPQLVNMYGITETTVHVTYRRIRREDLEQSKGSVIGRRLPDLELYILDESMRPVPVGVAGEIFVGGSGLARGYLRRPDATAERFVPHLYSSTAGARLYRTGDRARYLIDGDIEYLGRLDQQVKIRGYRIETGEVAATLSEHPDVREAVVVAQGDVPGEKRLVAYIVAQNIQLVDATDDQDAPANGKPGSRSELKISDLRRHLRERLPDYMVPSFFVMLDALPVTANGKLNYDALPAPQSAQPSNVFIAPRTPTEEMLANIWSTVLGVEQVGVEDNFFELGGHSLLATQVLARLRDAFQVEIALRSLFEEPTIGALSKMLDQKTDQSGFARPQPLILPVSRDAYRVKLSKLASR